MDRLPPEIVSNIVDILSQDMHMVCLDKEISPRTWLAPYASISRQWRNFVEARTWRHLSLNPATLATAEANDYFTPARLATLRFVSFNFVFPAHDLAVSTDPEDYDDQLFFNRMLGKLFGLVSRIPLREEPSVGLEIYVATPRIYQKPGATEIDALKEWDDVDRGRIRTTYLELSPDWDTSLPEIPQVVFFRAFVSSRSLVFAPCSINLLASKMTRLTSVHWLLSDEEKVDADMRIDQRTRFAQTLDRLPKSITNFNLRYRRGAPRNQAYDPPSIVPPGEPGDMLSRAFYHFTKRDGLRDFAIVASVDSTILWLREPDDNPHWPTLRLFHVGLRDTLPTGGWLYERDPEGTFGPPSDDEDYHPDNDVPGEEYDRSFPSRYNQAVLDEFGLAAARRASHMPGLEELFVSDDRGDLSMCILFIPDEAEPHCLEFGARPRLPEPSEEVLDAWREAIRVHGLKWDLHISDGMSHRDGADYVDYDEDVDSSSSD
ncbi:hypothetical protein ACJZ2D_003308 [Fusarium nematophilum]